MKEETAQHPIVVIEKDQSQANSLNVAACFSKQHKNVIRDIESLDVPDDFRRLNFEPSNYLNGQGKTQPMYNMNRDGFTVLVMGYTGPKAMKFKLAYIDAFNKMEETLRQKQIAAISMEMAQGQLAALRSGIALQALLQDRHALERVEQFYYFRAHGLLTHYEAADACRLEYNKADEIARTLREIGASLPIIAGNLRKKEISRFFAKAVGGFLPDELKAALTKPAEVPHEQ